MGNVRNLVWNLMEQTSLQAIAILVRQWFSASRLDFHKAIGFDIYMEKGEWHNARCSLERSFGASHPKYSVAIEILRAAVQAERLIKARQAALVMHRPNNVSSVV